MTSSFKAFFWNARGVANPATQRYIAQLCRTHHPHIVCIAELWTWTHLVQDFWSALGLKLLAVNNRDNLAPNLWFFCAAHISTTLISSSAQQVSVSLMIQNTPCLFSAIYASTAVFSRRQLWRDLQLLNFQGPWCCIGDFNAVLGAHEKVGGHPPPSLSCADFLSFTNDANLLHLPTSGTFFTWTNGRRGRNRIQLRLDRALCNSVALDFWDALNVVALPRFKSDHSPLLLTCQLGTKSFASPFKFMKVWCEDNRCKGVVQQAWSQQIYGCPMFVLSEKLKCVKQALKSWNRNHFGHIQQNVHLASKALDDIQRANQSSTPDLDAEFRAHLKLDQALHLQACFWKDRSRIRWHTGGDRCTEFFHKYTRIKQATKGISVLQHEGSLLTTQDAIEGKVISYFSTLYSSPNVCTPNSLIHDVIPELVTSTDNEFLTALPLDAEIRKVVFDSNADAAPGPDGFGCSFFQTFWDVVRREVCVAVRQFFSTGWILPNMNSSVVALIPKSPDAIDVENYRPIAVANFKFKLITKIIADRLATIAPKIISPQQCGFVKGRHIIDCIGVVSESINVLHKKTFGGNVALKLDICKAFDTLDWKFILDVLKAFGFCDKFCDWVSTILQSARLSFSVNGHAAGFISCSRGVRQGDLLSYSVWRKRFLAEVLLNLLKMVISSCCLVLVGFACPLMLFLQMT